MDKPAQDTLSQTLSDHGIETSIEEVRDIIRGVAAAPDPDGAMGPPEHWQSLIGSAIPPELADILNAELDHVRSIDDGLTGKCPSGDRLADLRQKLTDQKINGFIVPLVDEHQGEYVPKNAQRLAWLTGFTGSAGLAIALTSKAALFVDGRYTLQAREQVDGNHYELNHLTDTPADKWLTDNLKAGDVLGFDPWLHTADGIVKLRQACEKAGAKLIAQDDNPVDQIWHNQPPPPLTPVALQDPKFAGQSSAEKCQEISTRLNDEKLDACILTAPDSIAWLANIRGGDVPYTPFTLAFGIIHGDGRFDIYADPRKYPSSVRDALADNLTIQPRSEFIPALISFGKIKAKVGVDLSTASEIISQTLKNSGAIVQRFSDPCQLPKAKKNTIELTGMRNAHLRDGVALTRFLAWLDKQPTGENLTEMSVADQLEAFRREGDLIQGLSFPTISGAGPNGAIVHYRVTPESNRQLDKDSLYLVDSGAQYLDGTTDVTRTIGIGAPSAEMKDRFTRVLKGHIALASATFPVGTSGSQLDLLARAPLWQAGLDYDHGTGHGVGSYLSVHEGPQRISKLPNRVALEPGMIVSNEPGYYNTGAYGIRIENLVAVIEVEEIRGSERPMLGFETLTLAPIDQKLIDRDMLNSAEMAWLNTYHHRVYEALAPLLDDETNKWLNQATTAIT